MDVETFCAFEIRPNVTNILVTGCILETELHEKHVYKKMEVPFSSTLFRYSVAAPVVSDSIARAFNRSETIRALALGIFKIFDRIFHADLLQKIQVLQNFRLSTWPYFVIPLKQTTSGCTGWEFFIRMPSL